MHGTPSNGTTMATYPTFVPPEDVNKYLFNADTIDQTLKTLMTHGLKVAGGDRLGKTIIFAQNKKHAEFIVERFNACYPEHQGDFAQVIVHGNDFAQDLIDKFSEKDKAPHIAVSVDMLDTGIDVPEVVNLVFAKLVRSKTKFWQMIGRGTRLCADLFGPGQNKLGFLVFDLCRNVEFFNQDIPRAEGRLQPSLSERIFRHRADLLLSLDQRQPTITPPEDGAPDGTKSEERAALGPGNPPAGRGRRDGSKEHRSPRTPPAGRKVRRPESPGDCPLLRNATPKSPSTWPHCRQDSPRMRTPKRPSASTCWHYGCSSPS